MLHPSPNQTVTQDRDIQPYQMFMLLLCVYSLMSLSAETFFRMPTEQVAILDAIDNVICGVFLLDFFIHLGQAPSKLSFLKWGWIDLLSSIPVIDVFRTGRIVRVVRILRVLRGIRLARILATYLKKNRADGAILAAIFVSFLLLLLASVAILQVEQVASSNIKTGSDALWWAIATMTTVGYGDKYPVTTAGRIIAAGLMVAGVGLFGTLSGAVTSWILNPVEERQEIDLNSIHDDLEAINRRLDEVTLQASAKADPQLIRVIEAWPNLPEVARRELQQLIEAKSQSPGQ